MLPLARALNDAAASSAAAQRVVFLIIERDIKRFMVYSYRRCSGWRSVEIDTAITAGLVTGCDSHMLAETKVEVAGGVPPARERGGRGLPSEPGAAVAPEEQGTRCWSCTQCHGPFGGRTGNCSWGVSFTEHKY